MKEKSKPKKIFFAESGAVSSDRMKSGTFYHAIIAILVGVSVPYFIIDIGEKVYTRVTGEHVSLLDKILPSTPGEKALKDNMDSVEQVGQGSNDIITDDDTPTGESVPINPLSEGEYYFLGPNYKVPNTSGFSYVVEDVDTGEVIIEKNPDSQMPIASVSKLITALVAKENMDLHSPVTVTKSSIETYGSSGGLHTGEKILVSDLFYPLLMESSNDAAEVFAEAYGRDEFIKKMNAKAKELGMNDTSFFEPSGLSEKNVSTAHDLQKLAAHITKEHPELWDITRVRQYSILSHTWGNGNRLSRKSNFLGGKNGFTYEAHNTTVSIFEVNVEGGKRRFAITLLKSNDREGDVDALLRFLSKWVGFLPAGQEL